MNDHIRVNSKTLDLTCTHCGSVEPLKPNLTARLEDQIADFKTTHGTCAVPVFEPGDRVSFCGEEATVVTNYGDEGMVDLGGGQKCRWYWMFQGERVMPVKKEVTQ